MITNLTILCGILCGVLGRKHSCVFMWSVLLHTLLAIYLSVMLTPTLVGVIPVLGDRNWLAVTLILTAVGLFAAASILVVKLLSEALEYCLPGLWDQCGAGLCAFGAGFLAINFVLFAISVAPKTSSLLKSAQVSEAVVSVPLRHASTRIATACQLVSNFSLQSDRGGCRRVIDWLFEKENTTTPLGDEQPLPGSPPGADGANTTSSSNDASSSNEITQPNESRASETTPTIFAEINAKPVTNDSNVGNSDLSSATENDAPNLANTTTDGNSRGSDSGTTDPTNIESDAAGPSVEYCELPINSDVARICQVSQVDSIRLLPAKLGNRREFKLTSQKNERWDVSTADGATIAHLGIKGGRLLFRWSTSKPDEGSHDLRFCTLQIDGQDGTRYIQLGKAAPAD